MGCVERKNFYADYYFNTAKALTLRDVCLEAEINQT